MNAGLHEWPLVIFTVLAQSVVGAFLVMTITVLQTDNVQYRQKTHHAVLILLVLLSIGFVASILHLGSPWRAFNALNRIGSSMLSNEIASGALFFTAVGLYWLLKTFKKLSPSAEKTWLILTALCGLLFMYTMNRVYHISTVPTWNSAFTSWTFYLTVIIGGSVLGYALFHRKKADTDWARRLLIAGIGFAAVIALYQAFSLHNVQTSVQQAAALVPDYAVMTALRLLCLASGALLLFRPNPTNSLLAVILVLAAEMIGRTLFYGLHMTAGTAVGG